VPRRRNCLSLQTIRGISLLLEISSVVIVARLRDQHSMTPMLKQRV